MKNQSDKTNFSEYRGIRQTPETTEIKDYCYPNLRGTFHMGGTPRCAYPERTTPQNIEVLRAPKVFL